MLIKRAELVEQRLRRAAAALEAALERANLVWPPKRRRVFATEIARHPKSTRAAFDETLRRALLDQAQTLYLQSMAALKFSPSHFTT